MEKGITLHEEVVELINLGIEEDKKELKVVNNLEKEKIIDLFKEFLNVFAWSYLDMLGLDPQIASHKIPLSPDICLKSRSLRG